MTQEQKLCFAWKIFSKESFSYFKEIVDQKIKDHIPEVEILAMNHDKDHIHIQISIPPKIRISDLVRTIKSISARLLKKRFEYNEITLMVIEIKSILGC